MKPTETLDLDAIQSRVDTATSGPWMVDGDDPTVVMKPDSPPSTWDGLMVARTRGTTGTSIDNLPEYADAEFIAHARTDIPALIAAVRDRDSAIARVWELIDQWRESSDAIADYHVAQAVAHCADALQIALDPEATS